MKSVRSVGLFLTAAGMITLIGVLVSHAGSQQTTPPGEQLYRGYCSVCHGEKGDGRGIAALSFGGKIADFTNPEYGKKIDDKKIVNAILKGQGRMPAQSVSPEEARAIVEYMKSAFKGQYGS